MGDGGPGAGVGVVKTVSRKARLFPKKEEVKATDEYNPDACKTIRWRVRLGFENGKSAELILYGEDREVIQHRLEEAIGLYYSESPVVSIVTGEAGYVTVSGKLVLPADEQIEVVERWFEKREKKKG